MLIFDEAQNPRPDVLEQLPKELYTSISRSLRDAWVSSDALLAKRQLQRLTHSLERIHPGAAASLQEGLDETLTVCSLGIDGALYRTLRTTNPIENLNGLIAHYTRNVKRWRDGHMLLRWMGSAIQHAAGGFLCVRGHRDMHWLISVLKQRVRSDSYIQLKVA